MEYTIKSKVIHSPFVWNLYIKRRIGCIRSRKDMEWRDTNGLRERERERERESEIEEIESVWRNMSKEIKWGHSKERTSAIVLCCRVESTKCLLLCISFFFSMQFVTKRRKKRHFETCYFATLTCTACIEQKLMKYSYYEIRFRSYSCDQKLSNTILKCSIWSTIILRNNQHEIKDKLLSN